MNKFTQEDIDAIEGGEDYVIRRNERYVSILSKAEAFIEMDVAPFLVVHFDNVVNREQFHELSRTFSGATSVLKSVTGVVGIVHSTDADIIDVIDVLNADVNEFNNAECHITEHGVVGPDPRVEFSLILDGTGPAFSYGIPLAPFISIIDPRWRPDLTRIVSSDAVMEDH